MKRLYNDYEDILTKQYKKEQNEKLNIRIRIAKSIINNNCPKSYNTFHKRPNKSHGNEDISKKIYNKNFN
jgi:hypothetical protein